MGSSFFGLNVAISGLYTAQRGLAVVNHNINNVSTPSYSRQLSVQSALPAMPVYNGTGMVGTGSYAVSVERIHDDYLDFKYWSENIVVGEWSVKAEQLETIEKLINEPSDSGFNVVMNDFFSAVQELSKNPNSMSVRKLVIGKGVTLTKYFNNLAVQMEKMQSDLNNYVKLKVDEINSLGTQIQQLNRQICIAELDGNSANDLRDQRTALVDSLSKLVNIEAYETVVGQLPSGADDKRFTITIGGKAFVDHFSMNKLQVKQREEKININEDISHLYDVIWEDGSSVNIKGGELKGYLDMRDGNEGQDQGNGPSPNYKGVPFYIKKLNEFVRKFALAMNEGIIERVDSTGTKVFTKIGEGHADGYGMQQPGKTTSPTGIRFFTAIGWSDSQNSTAELTSKEFIGSAATVDQLGNAYQTLTAKNFCLSGDLVNEVGGEYNIAASAVAGEIEDSSNLIKMINMRHDIHLFAEGSPEDYMKSLISNMGIDTQQAGMICEMRMSMVKQIENRRISVSGVSLDEEMANMVKYQHAYNAAAKMINTMAEIYDTLVNRVGMVGR
jgi:flagellar hook-associated protein 1 FlgK